MSDDVAAKLYEENKRLREENRKLTKRLAPLEERAGADAAREEALAAAVARGAQVSAYSFSRRPSATGPGIPSLLLSDLHVNETIDPRQIGGVNAFTPEIAKRRIETCFNTALDLHFNHMVKPGRDAIVIPVMGDLLDNLNGVFHPGERQAVVKGVEAAEYVADLLQPGFDLCAKEFGQVYSPWTTGNHGRTTAKMTFQDRNATNLDAAVFYILRGRLRGNKRIKMELAGGPRIIWTVYGHRFLGLHGDPESGMPRGGDSESGAVNVVARGVKRLRSLHMQIGQPFDTAVLGHYHCDIEIEGATVNGCVPGFGEYSNGRVFPFSRPFQKLFYTHPRWGITARWKVYLDKGEAHEIPSPVTLGNAA